MSNMPIAAALTHARGASQFSGDGAVMHRLADEIEAMRRFMATRRADSTGLVTELDVYDRRRA